jgi:phage-related minor tail protein
MGRADRAAAPDAEAPPDTGAADREQAEAAARAARRQDAGAETRAERALVALDVAIAELDLPPETADEVRAIYEETFEEGARVREAVRTGELDEDAARERQQALRLDAREELEALLEPDALRHIRRTIRRGGRGRL